MGCRRNSITSIIQTRDGYLWLGTLGGLVRFDGVKFTTFNPGNSPGLAGNRVIGLHEDTKGGLWIALEHGGLAHYAEGKFKTYTREDGFPDVIVRHISEDQLGNLWLSTTRGLVRMRDGRFSMDANFFGLPNMSADAFGNILTYGSLLKTGANG